MESESDPLTRRPVDLFEKEPLKGNSEVHLHTPTKFGEDRSKDLGGDREQTDRQTNRQTDKRCSIYSMMSTFQMKVKKLEKQLDEMNKKLDIEKKKSEKNAENVKKRDEDLKCWQR